jgi:hypothetical protein
MQQNDLWLQRRYIDYCTVRDTQGFSEVELSRLEDKGEGEIVRWA